METASAIGKVFYIRRTTMKKTLLNYYACIGSLHVKQEE
jgi:hypothetical protein